MRNKTIIYYAVSSINITDLEKISAKLSYRDCAHTGEGNCGCYMDNENPENPFIVVIDNKLCSACLEWIKPELNNIYRSK